MFLYFNKKKNKNSQQSMECPIEFTKRIPFCFFHCVSNLKPDSICVQFTFVCFDPAKVNLDNQKKKKPETFPPCLFICTAADCLCAEEWLWIFHGKPFTSEANQRLKIGSPKFSIDEKIWRRFISMLFYFKYRNRARHNVF